MIAKSMRGILNEPITERGISVWVDAEELAVAGSQIDNHRALAYQSLNSQLDKDHSCVGYLEP